VAATGRPLQHRQFAQRRVKAMTPLSARVGDLAPATLCRSGALYAFSYNLGIHKPLSTAPARARIEARLRLIEDVVALVDRGEATRFT
jgi:hypothetical protein